MGMFGITNLLALRWTRAALLAAACLTIGSSAWGSVSISYLSDPNQGAYPVSNSDLINIGNAAFLSSADTGYTSFSFDGGTSTTAALNDGLQGLSYASGNGALSSGAFDIDGTWTSTFYLNGGYDISQIDTIASWPAARASQAYTVSVRQVGNVTFTPVATIDHQVDPDQSSKIVITDTLGTIAYNVDAIQFAFTVATGGASFKETVYRELDVFGTATLVPEPSAISLAVAGGAVLLFFRFKRR
jgi:hypothetical protein